MWEVQDNTRSFLKSLTPEEKINFRVNIYYDNFTAIHSNKLPLMACMTAKINQTHYVVSGQCAINSERYDREILRK